MSNKCTEHLHHQWDYIGSGREGKEPIAADRTLYAKWICPYCDKVKRMVLDNE